MEQNNSGFNESDIKDFDEFCRYIDNYANSFGSPDIKLDPFVDEAMTLTQEEFLSLTADEASLYTYKLSQHIMFIRKELSSCKVKSDWCSDAINRILAKTYSSYSEYMKYEVRKQMILLDNTYATKVHELKLKIDSAISILESKIHDVERMYDIFRDYSRRKGFER